MILHYYRLFNVHVRTGMNLVLVNISICHQGETILVLDIHQKDSIVYVCMWGDGGGGRRGGGEDGVEPPTKFSKKITI